MTLVQVEYTEGDPDTYVLPLTVAIGERAARMREGFPHPLLANLQMNGTGENAGDVGFLYDALYENGFSAALLDAIAHHRRLEGADGELVASPTQAFPLIQGSLEVPLEPRVLKAEQSNTSVVYGDRFILKVFRRLDEGMNPDLEIGRFLTEKTSFAHVPPVTGAIEYLRKNGELLTLAILQGFVPNEGDAWQYTLDALGHYFERVLAHPEVQVPSIPQKPLLALSEDAPPPLANELIGTYLESARLLGLRTAELHVALASDPHEPAFAPEPFPEFDQRSLYQSMRSLSGQVFQMLRKRLWDAPDFAPEPFSTLYQRSLYQSMHSLTDQVFQLLRKRLKDLPDTVREEAEKVVGLEGEVLRRFRSLLQQKVTAMRIRCHGDYHLGQVLYTGKDFVIIDFEGEPARSLSERRIKRSPLRDVAGMLRSFHYASYAALFGQVASVRPEDFPALDPWARFWHLWVSATFLKAYLEVGQQAPFLPQDRGELQVLLDAHLLEKAIYELGYELNNRPDWVKVPLQGILQLLEIAG